MDYINRNLENIQCEIDDIENYQRRRLDNIFRYLHETFENTRKAKNAIHLKLLYNGDHEKWSDAIKEQFGIDNEDDFFKSDDKYIRYIADNIRLDEGRDNLEEDKCYYNGQSLSATTMLSILFGAYTSYDMYKKYCEKNSLDCFIPDCAWRS